MTPTETKVMLWKCIYCSCYFPEKHKTTLVLHLQWHVEESPRQPAGNHTCLRNAKGKHMRAETCGTRLNTPTEMANHLMENHTRRKHVHQRTKRHLKATTQAEEERKRLIILLSQSDETPDRLFYPKDNKNGPRLRIDNMEFQIIPDNMEHIRLGEGFN